MPDHEDLAAAFEASRDRLRAIAYRMLGSLSDADDAELAGLPVIANVDFGYTTRSSRSRSAARSRSAPSAAPRG